MKSFCRYSLLLLFSTLTGLQAQSTQSSNPVVPGAEFGQFRHGTLVKRLGSGKNEILQPALRPQDADLTHPGIDLVANCGSPIYAFANATVKDTVSNDHNASFPYLGYMVLLQHAQAINGKDTYSIYLHMSAPPAVVPGQNVTGGKTLLGFVGKTGAAWGCHTHFEIRHFPTPFLEDKNWNYPFNIYGKGDQRQTPAFRNNWEDPQPLLASSQAPQTNPAPRASPINGGSPDQRFTIHTNHGDVSVIDFRKHPRQISADRTSVLIEDNDGFSISFYVPDSSFAITVEAKPVSVMRTNAEKGFLKDLGISQSDACKLLVNLGVPISVDYNAAGRNYGLSFCPGSIPFSSSVETGKPKSQAPASQPASIVPNAGGELAYFAFANTTGTALLMKASESAANPDSLRAVDTAVCEGGQILSITYDGRQKQGSSDTGRDTSANFNQEEGNRFRVTRGSTADSAICLLTTRSFTANKQAVKLTSQDGVQCDPQTRASLAARAGRQISACKQVGRIGSTMNLLVAQFAPRGNQLMAAIVLQQGQKLLPCWMPAKPPEEGSSWREGDGGDIMQTQFTPSFALWRASDGSIDLGINWFAEEGTAFLLLRSSGSELVEISHGNFYNGPT